MNTQEIEAQFRKEADIYFPNRYKFIPCFDEFILGSTNFIVSTQAPPDRVLDLGAGTGMLTALYRGYFPDAEYILVDFDENLTVAREWFKDTKNVEIIAMDYSKGFPPGKFDIILSSLSIHHFDDATKMRIFSMIYDTLSEGAGIANYDQFCASYGFMDAWQNGYWESQLLASGLSDEEILIWRQRLGMDKECTVSFEMDIMRECGFQAVCNLYTNLKFSVLTGIH